MTVKWQEVSSLLDRSSSHHARSAADRQLWAYLGALVALALLVPLHGLWAAQLLIIPLLLIVPGLILLRALRIPGDAIASSPVYVPCASLAVLLGSGLGIDLIGLATGMAAPLRPGPLLIGLEFICLALLASSVKAPAEVAVPWATPARPITLVWPLVLPLLAAAGALRLNSGHGNLVAAIALVASGIALITTFVLASRLSRSQLAVVLFAVSLALMWSFSLRGDLVYGYDIAAEYHASWLTAYLGIWHPAHPGDAYTALLSVTVLPAELQALTGMPTLLLFKVVYPAIAALFPVAVFGLAARVLTRRWAFAAAAFIVVQSTYFQTLPALARQEIALLFFAGLIVAMIDARLPRRSQWAAVAVFSLGMITSHYSTTYLAIGVIGLLLLLQWIVSRRRPIPRVSGAAVVALAVACLGGIAWYGLITRSASNLSQVIALAQADGLDLLPTAHGGNLVSAYLQASASIPLKPAQYAATGPPVLHEIRAIRHAPARRGRSPVRTAGGQHVNASDHLAAWLQRAQREPADRRAAHEPAVGCRGADDRALAADHGHSPAGRTAVPRDPRDPCGGQAERHGGRGLQPGTGLRPGSGGRRHSIVLAASAHRRPPRQASHQHDCPDRGQLGRPVRHRHRAGRDRAGLRDGNEPDQ